MFDKGANKLGAMRNKYRSSHRMPAPVIEQVEPEESYVILSVDDVPEHMLTNEQLSTLSVDDPRRMRAQQRQ